jgi:hypothetical protein
MLTTRDFSKWVRRISQLTLTCTDIVYKGHTQELSRHFSTLSLIGLASTCTISWTGLGLGLATEIGAGGPGAVRMARVQMIQAMNH